MGLTNEHVGPKILAKIKIYVLTRAELLFTLCYEIPCTYLNSKKDKNVGKSQNECWLMIRYHKRHQPDVIQIIFKHPVCQVPLALSFSR